MSEKRIILEMGTGNDLYGRDYTKAARRAVLTDLPARWARADGPPPAMQVKRDNEGKSRR